MQRVVAHVLWARRAVWLAYPYGGLRDDRTSEMMQLAATYSCTRAIDRSSPADYRSTFVITSLAHTRAGQSEHRSPPEWSAHLTGQSELYWRSRLARLSTTPTSYYHSEGYIFLRHLSAFGHRAILIWKDRDMAGGCSLNKPLLPVVHFDQAVPHWKWLRRRTSTAMPQLFIFIWLPCLNKYYKYFAAEDVALIWLNI